MTPADAADFYKGREASWVKHLILRRYLEKLAYKVGMWCQTINYVEGFAGPWQPADVELSDTSPHIALKELEKARVGLQRVGRSPRMRALFVEKNAGAAEALRASLEESEDTAVIRGKFLEVIPEIQDFIGARGVRDPRFTFLFVDPKGWTGFDPEEISSLLQAGHTEVLINLMTKDIIRFIDSSDEKTRQSFIRLFGSGAAWEAWQDRSGRDREDAIVQAFCRRLKEVGKFRHVASAVVLNPTMDRTYFHLIYGTRADEGLRTFRDVERQTLPDQATIRAAARQEKRIERTGQGELFQENDVGARSHVEDLAERYQGQARQAVIKLLEASGDVSFDDLEMLALQHAMTATADLKYWLDAWKTDKVIRLEGLEPRARSPKHGEGHRIIWLGNSDSGE